MARWIQPATRRCICGHWAGTFTRWRVIPSWLLTGRVFNAGIFFPAPLALAYSDHLLLQALALWPVYAITHDLIFCYNLLLIGSLAAAAIAMHVLARAITGSEAAAFVAGLIFGFAPYHFTHLVHIQLQALYFLPLSFFFLHRLFGAERRSDTIALGVVTALQTISSVYYGVIGAIGLACTALVLMAATRTDHRLAPSPARDCRSSARAGHCRPVVDSIPPSGSRRRRWTHAV